MQYKILKVRLTGVSPLLMHNGQLADPTNPFSISIKEITGKRKRTDADLLEGKRREFLGGLYMQDDGPCLPGEMIEAAIVNGAKKSKMGAAAKAGVIVPKNARLEYKGPRDPDKLWNDARFHLSVPANVNGRKVVRTRPHFADWSAAVEIHFHPDIISDRDVRAALVAAGELIGVGDWRPRFGRFTVA